MRQTKDVGRQRQNFTADEANVAVASLGFHLIVVVEIGQQTPYILDKNGYITPGEERYLVLHLKSGHWQSIGPNAQRALRVVKTRREPLDATRKKQLRIVLGTVIHDPIFDTGASIDELYVKLNEALPQRLKVPFKRAEIRDSLIAFDRTVPEDILTEYSSATGTARRRDLVTSQCQGRTCACGVIITPARLAQFRAGLAEAIHNPEFDNREFVDVISTLVNSFWAARNDQVSEIDDEETRAGLVRLSLDLDLVDFTPGKDWAKRVERIPVECMVKDCPCRSEKAQGNSPSQSRRSSNGSRKSPPSGQRRSSQGSKSPSQGQTKSPPTSAQPQLQISVGRMAIYRKALSEIMEFAEHRAMYYNPGVLDDRVLSILTPTSASKLSVHMERWSPTKQMKAKLCSAHSTRRAT